MDSVRDKQHSMKDVRGALIVRRLILISCIAMVFASCGKKSDPMVPVYAIPDSVKSFNAAVRPETVVLLWKAPRKNVNDSPLVDLAGFKIYRSGVQIEKACLKCPRNFKQIFDYKYTGPRGRVPGSQWMIYYDRSSSPGSFYTYQIVTYTEKGTPGKPSSEVNVYCVEPPDPPVSIRAEKKGSSMVFSWDLQTEPVEQPGLNIKGVNVYRRTRDTPYGVFPVNEKIVEEKFFQQVADKDNETFFYRLRTVAVMKDTFIESSPSEEFRVLYADTDPPSVPEALTVIPQREGVYLKWILVMDEDCAGYNVYRKEAVGQDWARLNKTLIGGASWTDMTARKNRFYVYGVTSVDSSARANESRMSETVKIKYIYR